MVLMSSRYDTQFINSGSRQLIIMSSSGTPFYSNKCVHCQQCTSVVLVGLHIIRFSFSKKANEEQSLILVLVSQLKRKQGY